MSGFQLFKSALNRVIANFPEALAVSGVVWIGVLIFELYVLGDVDLAQYAETGSSLLPPEVLGKWFLVNLVTALGSCWVAVAWHRFTLLGERPKSALPRFLPRNILLYFGWSIVIALVVVIFGSVALSFVGAIVGPNFAPALFAVVGWGMFYGFFRFSPILTATALGEGLRLGKAWERTAPISKPLVQLSVINILGFVLISAPTSLMPSGLLSTLYWLVAGWVLLIVSVSQLSIIFEKSNEASLR